jgi:transcriptional regulator of acetoin/glycerol metabolism
VVESTVSDVFVGRPGGARPLRRQTVLTLALCANRPLDPPSRHLLEDTDVVRFGRGDRSAVRDEHAGLRRLTLRVPDPRMSADHGRLLFTNDEWLLEDPRSKNGSVVAGQPTRCALVHAGDVFELGHTLFLLEAADLPPDLARDTLPPKVKPSTLATLHPRLGKDVELITRVATSDVPVLLLGETGTGKEIFARAVHELSGRRGPYVAVNCGGLAPSLVEAELFGHKRGAFSGAVSDRPGYLRSADRGTLFLDEVGELSPPAQAALLRALQQREVVPVGHSTPIPIDIRLCAATNRDLAAMVTSGAFREDLYARLLGLPVTLPPLRERRGDLGLLIASLLRRLPSGERACFVPGAAYALLRYRWPLNVRELERSLETALALARGEPISVEHLPETVVAGAMTADEPARSAPADEGDDTLRSEIVTLLTRHHGNIAAVARDMGKQREQIHRWARRLSIDLQSFRR